MEQKGQVRVKLKLKKGVLIKIICFIIIVFLMLFYYFNLTIKNIYIKGITQDIENEFQFNTVISKYRELTNVIYDWTSAKKEYSDEDKNVLSYAISNYPKIFKLDKKQMESKLK